MTAVRITVSIPAELDARMREADISPSKLFTDALKDALGENGHRPVTVRVADLEKSLKAIRRELKALRGAQNGHADGAQAGHGGPSLA